MFQQYNSQKKMQRLLIQIKTEDEYENEKCLQIKTKSSMFKKRLVKTWTAEQDERLVALYEQFPKRWNVISQKMKNRNQNQCLHRFRRICMLGQNKKIWSPQEDQIVMKMINKVGHNWKIIAQTLGSKSGKQIRQRFINKLDPNIRRQQWTQEQDLKIIQLFSKLGSKWCQISKCLAGRPENKIKNRFYSYIQKNYEFQVKTKDIPSTEQKITCQNKQNSALSHKFGFTQRKSSESNHMQKKISSGKILQQKSQNCFQQKQCELVNLKNEYDQKIQMQEQVEVDEVIQRQVQMNCNSLKEINDQCFFRYTPTTNNNDLLYFEDN